MRWRTRVVRLKACGGRRRGLVHLRMASSLAGSALVAMAIPSHAMTFTGAAPVALIYTAASLADETAPTPAALVDDAAAHEDLPPTTRPAPRRRGFGGVLMELPADVVPGQPPGRPRYIVGFRSESMRNWLNEAGFSARNCFAPMVRANTRVSSDGLRGTLWLYARCSFD